MQVGYGRESEQVKRCERGTGCAEHDVLSFAWVRSGLLYLLTVFRMPNRNDYATACAARMPAGTFRWTKTRYLHAQQRCIVTIRQTANTTAAVLASFSPSRLCHSSEHKHCSKDEVQILGVLLNRVELEHVVVREGVEVQALNCSGIEHHECQLLYAIRIVRVAQLHAQAIEAV